MNRVFLFTALIFAALVGIFSPIVAKTLSQQPTSPTRSSPLQRPYVGIKMVNLTPQLAQQINEDPTNGFKVKETEGVLIIQVIPDSPAANAGLHEGDLIAEVAKQPVNTAKEVAAIVNNTPSTQLSFVIIRDLPNAFNGANRKIIPILVNLAQTPVKS